MMRIYRIILVTTGLLIATYLLLSQYLSDTSSMELEVLRAPPIQTGLGSISPRALDTFTTVSGENTIDELSKVKLTRKVKTILYWTPMFEAIDWYLGFGTKIFENCTYTNCYTTNIREEIPVEEFDAIIFHGVEYREDTFGKPAKRSPHQFYIFSTLESPVHSRNYFRDYNNFYNWTMTYQLDSDILRSYGYIQKQQTGYELPTAKEIEARPKKIAWFVSHCKTPGERERLYNELSKHIPVDVYGACGNFTCPRNRSRECYKILEEDYKFYLSFENSICKDYVTEKLFNMLLRNIVPIVYGGADYSIAAPPKSVINVMDFKSIGDLVEYIRYLDTHTDEYLKYFEWKKDYVVSNSIAYKSHQTLCSLCRKLNEPIEPKTYNDLVTWWDGQNSDKCSSGFLKLFL